jgi:hypothetical protein
MIIQYWQKLHQKELACRGADSLLNTGVKKNQKKKKKKKNLFEVLRGDEVGRTMM